MIQWLKKRWRCSRTRWCARCLLWPLLLGLALLVWLGTAGLPAWALRRFEVALRDQGVPLEASRAQFDLVNGLTLREARLGMASGSRVSFDRAVVRIRWQQALRGVFDPIGLRLEGGLAAMAFPGSSGPPLEWTRLEGDLRRRGGQGWDLSSFVAHCGALELRLEGVVREPGQFVDWVDRVFPTETAFDWRPVWRAMDSLAQFPTEEPIRLTINGLIDGDRIAEADLSASVRFPDVVSAHWGVKGARLALVAPPVVAQDAKPVTLELRCDRIESGRSRVEALRVSLAALCDPDGVALLGATVNARAERLAYDEYWIEGADVELGSNLRASGVVWADLGVPQLNLAWEGSARRGGGLDWALEGLRVGGGVEEAGGVSLELNASTVSSDGAEASSVMARMQGDSRFQRSLFGSTEGGDRSWEGGVTWELSSGTARARDFRWDSLAFQGAWSDEGGAEWALTSQREGETLLEARGAAQDQGPWRVTGTTRINIPDVLALAPELAAGGIASFEFESAPEIHLEWEAPRGPEGDQDPSLAAWILNEGRLRGRLVAGAGAFRGVRFSGAEAGLSLQDGHFETSGVRIERPEGVVEITYRQNIGEAAYTMDVSGQAHAADLRGLFGPETQQIFDHFTVEEPVVVSGQVTGPWETGEGTVDAKISGNGWTIRDVPFEALETQLYYGQERVRVTDLSMRHASGPVTAERVDVALEEDYATLHNVVSRASPQAMAALFDEEDLELFDLLQFYNQPTVRVSGRVDYQEETVPDLELQVDGRRGLFGRYFLDTYTGGLRWRRDEIWLHDFLAAAYQGSLMGSATFDLREGVSSDLAFSLNMEALDLQRVLRDAVDDGSLIGRLDGTLDVTSGMMDDEDTWIGSGSVAVRDGRLIDEPIFGVVSTLLNRVAPGLGNIRASRAQAQFILDAGQVRTGNLEIAGAQVGLIYRGTIGLDGAVRANAEAFLFDDRELIGKVGNLTLAPLAKTFTFRITGHVSEPQVEPLFLIPKILVAPLKPFETLDRLLPFDLPFR